MRFYYPVPWWLVLLVIFLGLLAMRFIILYWYVALPIIAVAIVGGMLGILAKRSQR